MVASIASDCASGATHYRMTRAVRLSINPLHPVFGDAPHTVRLVGTARYYSWLKWIVLVAMLTVTVTHSGQEEDRAGFLIATLRLSVSSW